MQYLADSKPAAKLAPANGTLERYQLQEWLNYITSELHKGFSPLFNAAVPDEYKKMAKENLANRFSYLDKHLAKSAFITGDAFTVADAYAWVVVNWSNFVGIELGQWPNLKAYHEKVAERPAVQQALKEEGLIK